MFKKILIANRGEIACRVIRTAHRLGIRTVAVYSEADVDSLHVRLSDEAVAIGPAPSAESYLKAASIIEAAAARGAEAVHPGFGFLSENAEFAAAVRTAGLVFLGPPAAAISAMGDKLESKRLAERAGVSIVPGHPEAVRDAGEALAIARDIGFPVMLKASAGGGGKGMRIARGEAAVREGFAAAKSEARSSFGDDRILVERYVDQPRHIEIQVLADTHGNIVHLGERECSIQRRHQKVLEEAPSPFIDPETREAMGAQAVALARAVGYQSAGTVEFIVDGERRFYFLEMNTRLQVEHPVTEMVTGLDLVEQMLRIGAGERLSFDQSGVRLRGWALEARIYAEDPERAFLPATGRLVRYRPPAESDSVRVDTGVDEGSEIGVFYDPMIAKLVTSGATRGEALERMGAALDAYTIRGLAHNVGFLGAVVRHPRFRAGALSTAFIDEEFPDGYRAETATHPDRDALIALAAMAQREVDRRDASIGDADLAAGRIDRARFVAVLAVPEREEREVTVREIDGVLEAELGGRTYHIRSSWRPGLDCVEAEVNGRPMNVQLERRERAWVLSHAGHRIGVRILAPRAAELHRLMPVRRPPDLSKFVLSPMPGLLVRLCVAVGDVVKAGQEVAVVEAMKMENVLFAAEDATVSKVLVAAGDGLSVDQPLVEFE